MITASAGVKVMVATKPADFRKGADGLAALMDGLDWSRLHARDVAQPTATS
jgi:hypothetical protein